MRRFLFLFLVLFTACQRFAPTPKVEWQKWEGDLVSQEKPVLFYFDAKWCPYCARLEETVFQDKAVVELSKQFLTIKVDGDDLSADGLMKKYSVKGYPTLVFAKGDGTPIAAWLSDPDPQTFAGLMMEVAGHSEPHSSWQEHLKGTLKSVDMEDDPYWMEAESLEKEGKLSEAKEVYRRGGLALLEKINRTPSLKEVRSLLSGTLALLLQGEAFKEGESLAKRAIQVFPEDFLYYHRLAALYKAQGKLSEAIATQQKAFEKSHGRNRMWVGYQLTELLVAQGEEFKTKANEVMVAALASVNWETNTRQKELKFKEKFAKLAKEFRLGQ